MFFELHAGLPREGPGDDASTERALRMLLKLPARSRILDVGCGPGAQTLVLARGTGGTVTAVDLHQPFLDELMQRARAAGLAENIHPMRASMDALTFVPDSFDLVWSEGAIYIMGFERGLRAWQPFVRRGGYVVVSELSWLVDDPPAPARTFWEEAYPAMRPVAENLHTVERCGYERLAKFVLPKSAWLNDYYAPLARRMDALERDHAIDPAALEFLADQRREIDLFHVHGDTYGYVFYLMRRP
ncbi:MAG TPA: class I SAM-dependent methyltransferase [Candidatus Elarobacter sp.]|nr:class I SAM-dependent methyltransferase [Candidatus Elarobacter sp.]HEV2738011.1 class I SAM-dependent methyltransferase [Candidatus Elarobacter sp.]